MQIRTFFTIISITLTLMSCTSYDFSKRSVQQGNLLSSKRIAHLKIGMSKADAAILMGTSLLSPMFNNDRWDYAYTYRKANKPLLISNLVLYFQNDRLIRIEKK
ncbi:MAG: outer membrane protein assembly factor BamE [Legionellaceae bacterium]|nr:outer membrane protein assembly factor BamE [Legionellaceae bacterium]